MLNGFSTIQRMEDTSKGTSEPEEWRCANCGNALWLYLAPDFPCFKCQQQNWLKASEQVPVNNQNNQNAPEQDYEIVLLEKCTAIQNHQMYKISVMLATNLKNKALVVPAKWGHRREKLNTLITAFRDGNIGRDRHRVHLGGGLNLDNPDHKFVWQKIGSALVEIVDFIIGLLGSSEATLVAALYQSGFMDELFGYIAKPSCNENGAARLQKAFDKIEFTRPDEEDD